MTRKAANLAVFCSGFGSNFQAILDAIKRKKLKARVAVMVCDNPKAYALTRARKHRVPVFLFDPRHFKSREDYERIIVSILKSENVGLVALAGFMRILTPYFIRVYKNRIVNIHPSLLPKFKGSHAIRDALEAGAKVTGATVHVVTNQLDAGPIILQKKVKISSMDTSKSLEKRIHRTEHQIYPLAIKRYIKLKKGSHG